MIRPEQKYARDLSRRHREDRLTARAIERTRKPVKGIPEGRATDEEWIATWARRTPTGELTWLGGAGFPREWL